MQPSAPLVGIGWRHAHDAELLQRLPRIDFLEVHSENFFGKGGAARQVLRQGREHYEISLHGVGLGLGSAVGLDPWHLERLAELVADIEPRWVSEHACFARAPHAGLTRHAADLLPVPFSDEALEVMADNVQRVQDRLRRPILVENLSAYLTAPELASAAWALDEAEFLMALARRTGCGLLVDLNNLYVNALNAQPVRDEAAALAACQAWLDRIAPDAVGELHLAGHCRLEDIVIDDHGSRVSEPVWQLHAHAVARWNAVPTLIEWDTDLPELDVLLGEAERARRNTPTRAASKGPLAPDHLPAPVLRESARAQDAQTGPLAGQQARLLRALLAPTHAQAQSMLPPGVWVRGLKAYRSHGAALAERCLRAAYPACATLLGADNWRALAVNLWQSDPPQQGDLALWGGGLATHVGTLVDLLQAEPWLADLARLEWAMHRVETAVDAHADLASLALLGTGDPSQLALVLAPGLCVLALSQPSVALREAVLAPDPSAREPQALAALAYAPPGDAEFALVWRSGWRVQARAGTPAEARWLKAVLHSPHLEAALDMAKAAGEPAEAFDPNFLGPWLASAVADGVLLGVHVVNAEQPQATQQADSPSLHPPTPLEVTA